MKLRFTDVSAIQIPTVFDCSYRLLIFTRNFFRRFLEQFSARTELQHLGFLPAVLCMGKTFAIFIETSGFGCVDRSLDFNLKVTSYKLFFLHLLTFW